MGASGWAYFVPYQEDIEKALLELRQREFDAGRYFLLPRWEPVSQEEFVEEYKRFGLWEEDETEYILEEYESIKERFKKPAPETIPELFDWNREEGTHSIIDILKASDNPDDNNFATVRPLTSEKLEALFGTSRPTHAMIKQKSSELVDLRSRGEGTYIIVYDNDTSSEIYFCGYSGD